MKTEKARQIGEKITQEIGRISVEKLEILSVE